LSDALIPVTVVTGALGSGKTTLIGRVLRDPGFTRTAVIVNEFGDIPLDHDLIASADENLLTLATGCLCCTVQTDLARTMLDLLARRQAGDVTYDRVLVETSGLSDPAPLMQALLGDPGIAATHHPPFLVAVVDTVHGASTLADRPEARRQVALADRLLLSKTDLHPCPETLLQTLEVLNRQAPLRMAAEATAADLFGDPAPLALVVRLDALTDPSGHADIDSFTLTRERPVPALALALLLQALAEHCGRKLLRLKGIVAIEEMPDQPAVIHGVRHVVSAPEFLAAWPSADRSTRIVFIGSAIPRWFPARLLDAIEAEVREAQAAIHP
jgi:G3E family GTPase